MTPLISNVFLTTNRQSLINIEIPANSSVNLSTNSAASSFSFVFDTKIDLSKNPIRRELQSCYLIDVILESNRKFRNRSKCVIYWKNDLYKDKNWHVYFTKIFCQNTDLFISFQKMIDDFLRIWIIEKYHVIQILIHPNRDKIRQLLIQNYYWSDLTKDVKRYVKNCRICK